MLRQDDFTAIALYNKETYKTEQPALYKNVSRWLQVISATQEFIKADKATVLTLLDLCYRYQLNPIQNDVYLLPIRNKIQIFVAYDAIYRMALSTGDIDFWNVEEHWDKEDATKLIRVDVIVKRKSQNEPTKLSYLMKEWNKNTEGPWKTMPAFMLRKCAIARTFSLLFQDVFSDMKYYSEAEAWDSNQEKAIKEQQTIVQEAKILNENGPEVEDE